MNEIVKAITFTEKNNAELLEVGDRMPGENEIRIKMSYSALSAGTERALITCNEDGDKSICSYSYPCVPGYSGSGVITHVGEGVTEFAVGDRVMVHGGGHKSVCTVNQKEAVKVPDNVDLLDAAFVIVSGFSLAAVRKARVELGHNVLVVGLGLLGLFSVEYLKLSGACNVIVSDFNPERRALALKLGADYALDPSETDYVDKVRAITGGKGVDSVIEVTGNAKALKSCLKCTKKFGRVILLGCTRMLTEVDFYTDVHVPGIELVGAHSGARPTLESHPGYWTEMDDCRVTLSYLAKERLDFKSIVHEVHSPEDAHDVYARLCKNELPIGVAFDWGKLDK